MDRVLWTAVLGLLLGLLVPLTHTAPVSMMLPSVALDDQKSTPADDGTRLVIECTPLPANPQLLVAQCTANLPLGE